MSFFYAIIFFREGRKMSNYLPLSQTTQAAKILLNVFGLKLEESEEIEKEKILKITNSKEEEVGFLNFQENLIYLEALSNFGLLKANYEYAPIYSFIDYKRDKAEKFLWKHDIQFEVEDKIQGNFLLECFMDTSLGYSCIAHPTLEYKVNDHEQIQLKFLNHQVFSIKILTDNQKEEIDIMPYDKNSIRQLIHCITVGNWDYKKKGYPYRKYAGILKKGENNNKEIRSLVFLSRYDKEDYYIEKIYARNSEDEKEFTIQKGLLMKSIDTDMEKRVKEVKDKLTENGISLMDNLISICLDSYTDEEIQALLGLERKKESTLTETYFNLKEVKQKVLSKNKK